MTLAIFLLVCTGVYYLVARAQITRWVWEPFARGRKHPGVWGVIATAIDGLLTCPACSGFWIGLIVGHWLAPRGLEHLFPGVQMVAHGLLGMVGVACLYGIMHWGMSTAMVVPPDEDDNASLPGGPE